MTIYIDADKHLQTWKYIRDAGGFVLYRGVAIAGDIIIRWGANYGRYNYPDGTRILNSHLIINKAIQGRRIEKAGVPIPKIYKTRVQWAADNRPEVVSKPIYGYGGFGIEKTGDPTFGREFVIQRYVDKVREFRAMMVGNLLAFFMEKFQPDNGDFRWNEHQGAHWTRIGEDERLRTSVKKMGKQALDAIKYDFGAIDIIMDNRGRLYILEINSRPEFGEVNAKRFARAIIEYCRG